MVNNTEKKPLARVLTDFHKVAVDRWLFPEKAHYPKNIFTKDEFDNVKDLILEVDPYLLIKILKPISFDFYRFQENQIPELLKPLLNYPLIEKVRKKVDRYSHYFVPNYWLSEDNRDYFLSYWPNSRIRSGYEAVAETGIKITYVTGTPDRCADSFYRISRRFGLVNSADPLYSAFLQPTNLPEGFWINDKLGPVAPKLLVPLIFKNIDGLDPIVIDDVIEINELQAILGLESYNPISKQEAEHNRRWEVPDDIKKTAQPGWQERIHFSSNLSEIMDRYHPVT